jgi:hypothetical protein
VRCIREQCERVDDDPRDDLDGHEADDQSERGGQPLRVGVRADAMAVRVRAL